MTYPHRPGGPSITRPVATGAQQRWTARRQPVAPQTQFPMRRFEAVSLLPDNSMAEIIKRAPAHPLFESAFCALARGTIMATEDGPVAVEDLLPGIKVETRDSGYQPLMWIGTITLLPNQTGGQTPSRLFRIPVDSFGPSRPTPDLMLAPHARLLHRNERLRDLVQDDSALTPVSAFEDGQSVLDALRWIRGHADASLAVRYACINANACKECVIRIDGRTGYACTTRLVAGEMLLEPLANKPLVRDLVTETVPPDERLGD